MSKQFGLGQKTGIELGETVTPSPTKAKKIASYKASLWSYLYNSAHTYFPKDVYTNYPKLKKNINTICSWMEDNPSYTKLISLLSKKTDMKQSKIATAASNIKYTYFAQATWTIADQFNISIGQGDNAYTPIQMCTYISALANNGVYNRASLVSGVENKGMVDKSADRRTIKLKSTTIPSVVKGIKRVTRYGTLQTVFGSYKYSVAGKTGTAQNPHGKDHAIFIGFAPVEDPQIAVAVVVENAGYGATWACPVASMMMEQYLTGQVQRKDLRKKISSAVLNESVKKW